MKNLYSKIQDQIINELFDIINDDIICESLNCKILYNLAKQLKDLRGDERDEKENKRYRFYDPSRLNNYAFKDIFGNNSKSLTVQWDKITDDDVETLDTTELSDKDFRKTEKRIREIIQGTIKAIIISYNKESKKYDFAFLNWGNVCYLNNENSVLGGNDGYAGHYIGKRGVNNRWLELTTPDKLRLIKRDRNILYFIDLTDKIQPYNELKDKRSDEKKDMIYMDEESLKRMAENNKARYKKIVAQNKANRLNNTALIEEVGKIINKVTFLATEVAKDPVKNADLIQFVNVLTTYIYDERRYVSGRTPRQPGYYTGKNGLLPMLAKYTKSLNVLQTNGGTDYDRTGFKTAQDELKKTIDDIKKYAAQYNIEL